MLAGKKILIGVLNWGLGHASRSIQLIRQLESMGAEVIIASDGTALEFLKQEFPKPPFLKLPDLNVHYASVFGLKWSILGQIPKFLKTVNAEKNALDVYLREHNIDLIISDNRYGVYHSEIPSILLSHQINLQLKFGKRKANSIIRKLLTNFDELWIPDEEGGKLSGDLSRLEDLEIPKYYMGTYSHLSTRDESGEESLETSKYLAILSGPEPSRTDFEKKLVQLANDHSVPMKIIRGTTSQRIHYASNQKVEFDDQLSSKAIFECARQHAGIICRSGYSTVMDLSWLGLPAFLVPTPGQGEQEYLAEYLKQGKHFYSKAEKKIDLKEDLEIAFSGEYQPPLIKVNLEDQKKLMRSRFEELLTS